MSSADSSQVTSQVVIFEHVSSVLMKPHTLRDHRVLPRQLHVCMYVCVFARLGEHNHELVRGLPLQLIVRANTEGAARLGYRSASCLDHHVKHKR